MTGSKIAFVSSGTPQSERALARLAERYGNVAVEDADVIVALGGDGFMLRTLHTNMSRGVPIYGMRLGSVGFLMNVYREDDLVEHLRQAELVSLHPLRMEAITAEGEAVTASAINEVSLLRETSQAASLRVLVNSVPKIEELMCDGILVATPAGSTAYNLSANGPVLPLGSGALALTPISPFRPRRWRGAVLPREATVRFQIHEPAKRPVSATADATEVRDVVDVTVHEDRELQLKLLFDPEHNLEDRIVNEQFNF